MKVTVTKEFGSPEEAAAWLRIFSGASVDPRLILDPASSAICPITQALPQGPEPEQVKKPRKPRNDAGKPRGPYKTSNNAGENQAEAQAGSSGAAAPVPVPVGVDSPVSPAPAPAAPVADKAESPSVATPAAAAPLTEADARAALKRINETPGLGMEAVMTHLRDFGVNRVTLLKPEQYADFVKRAVEKVAAVTAAAARDAKAAK